MIGPKAAEMVLGLPVFYFDPHATDGMPQWAKLVYVAMLFAYAGVMLAGAVVLWRRSR